MKYDVFISYSRRDMAVADKLCEALDKAGISYWIDRNIHGSANFLSEIAQYIKNCRVVIFIASSNSAASPWTQKEILFATKHNKKIVPYRIGNFHFEQCVELDLFFTNVQWIETEQEVIEALKKLGCVYSHRKPPMPQPDENSNFNMRWLWVAIVGIAVGVSAILGMRGCQSPTGGHPDVTDSTVIEVIAETLLTQDEGRDAPLVREKSNANVEAPLVRETADDGQDKYRNLIPMLYVQGGSFEMGATSEQSGAYDDEYPVHNVTVGSFYMGKYEVTQAQWEAVMGTTLRQQRDKVDSSWSLYGIGGNYPMYYVSYEEAQAFCRKLSELTGRTYRLPTEAEWEYAARGGNKSKVYKYSGSNNIEEVAWYSGNSGNTTHVVGSKKANELGLHDMSGNVCEWCSDWYGDYSTLSQHNPKGASSGNYRVYRGGSWYGSASDCRVSYRSRNTPSSRYYYVGFRVILVP